MTKEQWIQYMAEDIIASAGDTTPGKGLINAPGKDKAHGSRYIIALGSEYSPWQIILYVGDTVPDRGLINAPGKDNTRGLSGR